MLRLEGLVKRYGSIRALDGCSLAVERGAMLGFLGPNGAGKTTAMRSIFGLVALDGGSVTWNGSSIGEEERRRFGYMSEQRGLYPRMRILDQLGYLGELRGMSATDAREGAAGWLEALDLADRMDDRLEELSHGNQQRVQLAAALIHDPDLLVLDEPFAGLDPIGVETLGAVLQEQAAAGKAVVFSSHQLDLVEDLCEEVAVINAGRIVLSGNVGELKARSTYRRLDIQVAGSDGSWVPDAPGVLEAAIDGDHVRLVVEATVDLDTFLHPARAAGAITHLAFEAPSLSELFLAAVRP